MSAPNCLSKEFTPFVQKALHVQENKHVADVNKTLALRKLNI